MYSKITNPKTGEPVSIKNRLGKNILRNFLFMLSGGAASQGASAIVDTVECSICLEQRGVPYQVVEVGECGHTFHIDCIERWYDDKRDNGLVTPCPLCRRIIRPAPPNTRQTWIWDDVDGGSFRLATDEEISERETREAMAAAANEAAPIPTLSEEVVEISSRLQREEAALRTQRELLREREREREREAARQWRAVEWVATRENNSSAQTKALRIMAQCVETSIGLKLAALYIPTEESYPESLHSALDDALHINPADGDILKRWFKEVFMLQFTAAPVPEWWRQTYSHLPTYADIINIHCSIAMNIVHLILVARPSFQLGEFQLIGATIAAMVLPEDLLTNEQIISLSLIPHRSSHSEVVDMRELILSIINVDPCCDRDCSHISPTLSARLTAVEDEETQDWSPTNGWVDDIRGRDVPGERVMVDLPFGDPDDERFITVEYPQQWATIDADGGIIITDPR